jgi:tetratricopeptide (TPR) repeat protein
MLALGSQEEGRVLLGQLRSVGFSGWERVALEYFKTTDAVPAQIGFTPCLVVDGDETIHKNLKQIFEKFPEFRIVPFVSGLAADEWCLRNGPPGMVIQEWKLRDLPGPALLQHMRQRGWHDLPIVVLSSLVGKRDGSLLKDMGVTEVFEKPVDNDAFREGLVLALVQEKDPTDLSVLERKIIRMLNMGNLASARLLGARVMSHPKARPGIKKYVQALFAFQQNNYEAARKLSMEAIQTGGDLLKCLTILARVLVRMRDFEGAVKCFERASQLSPDNIERLCELAEAYLESGDLSKADATLLQAKKNDPTNDLLARTESKIALRAGQVERAKSIIMHMSQVSGLVSELNNAAVALVKVAQYDQAFDLYRHTFEALPEEFKETRLRVRYNLALAFARSNRLRDSLGALEGLGLVLEGKDVEGIRRKIISLQDKVRLALENKRPLRLVSEGLGEELAGATGEVAGVLQDATANFLQPIDPTTPRPGLVGVFEPSGPEQEFIRLSQGRKIKFKSRHKASATG